MACSVACVVGYSSAAEGWGTDLDEGLATAAAEGRTVLVEFTGSDWCPPCMHVRAKILPTQEFKDFAEKNKLVLVELDFPRNESKVTPEVREEREKISARYQVDGFPTMAVLDGEGHLYAKIVGGDKSAVSYIARLEEGLKVKESFDAKMAAAAGLSGVERAHALVEALETLPEECRGQRTDVVEEVIACDPEDTTGFRKAAERKKMIGVQIHEFREALIRSSESVIGAPKAQPTPEEIEGVVAATRAEALKQLEREDLLPEVRQVVLGFIAESYLVVRDYAQAIGYLDQAIAAAPETAEVEQLRQLRDSLQKMKEAK